jgi:hypothetical protein
MKTTLKLGILFGLTLSVSLSAAGYGSAGCGLGSLLFKEDKKVLQILAATTNGIYANQTFGISSGTSNCTNSGLVHQDKAQEIFVSLNYESLEQEISMGRGEKLDTLAGLFGCSESKNFNSVAKKNFSQIFGKQDSNPSTLISFLKDEVKRNEVLKTSCVM